MKRQEIIIPNLKMRKNLREMKLPLQRPLLVSDNLDGIPDLQIPSRNLLKSDSMGRVSPTQSLSFDVGTSLLASGAKEDQLRPDTSYFVQWREGPT